MNSHAGPEDEPFDPRDWHASVSGWRFGYVANHRHRVAFDVSFRASDDSDRVFDKRFWIAEPMHWPETGQALDAPTLRRLRRLAVRVFLQKLHAVTRRLDALRALKARDELLLNSPPLSRPRREAGAETPATAPEPEPEGADA
jgi:hypothetical protein